MMSQVFWNKTHREKYSKADWATKPSIFADQVVKFFPKSGRVLDIGTGQGGDAEYFRSLGYSVTATDFSDAALESAKSRFKGIDFLKLDTAEKFPFPNGSFDVVYSHMALHYFDAATTRKMFKEIHRLLKPTGIFATITNTMDDPEKEIDHYAELEPGHYQDPKGIAKRYFSVDSMRQFTEGLFEPILLDAKGETYKDDIKTLIRFVGKRI